jgi:hypothetical protein
MENQTQRPIPNGTAVLVLGIISIVGCFCDGIPGLICGIIALVLAGKDLKLYNADPTLYTPGSVSNLKNGRICAIIGVSLSALCLVILIIYIFTVGWAVLSHPWMLHQSSM